MRSVGRSGPVGWPRTFARACRVDAGCRGQEAAGSLLLVMSDLGRRLPMAEGRTDFTQTELDAIQGEMQEVTDRFLSRDFSDDPPTA